MSMIISEYLRPKDQNQNPAPTSAGDVQVPTSEQGRVVPIVCGTCKLTGINTIDAWDLNIRQVYENVSTGWFSDKDVFKYEEFYLNADIGLCQGFNEDDYLGGSRLIDLKLDDKSILDGSEVTYEDKYTRKYKIDKMTLWGSNDEGGVKGNIEICMGYKDQPISQALAKRGINNAYRGLMHVIFGEYEANDTIDWSRIPLGIYWFLMPNQFLWGHSKYLPQPSAIIRRTPYIKAWEGRGINPTPGYHEIDGGLNPAALLYELYVRYPSKKVQVQDLDVESFIKAANTLKEEGMGYYGIIDSATGVDSLKSSIEKMIDGVVDEDEKTGKVSLRLIRKDYEEDNLPVFDKTNIAELVSFTRPSPQEIFNKIKLTYTDVESGEFKDKTITVEDISSIISTTEERANEIQMKSIGTYKAAILKAKRSLQESSYPLAKATIKTTSNQAQTLKRGDPVIMRYSEVNPIVPDLVYRVTKISKGNIVNQESEIELVQDIFGFSQADQQNHVQQDPWKGQPELDQLYAIEVPYEFSPALNTVAIAASRKNFVTTQFRIENDKSYSNKFVVAESLKVGVTKEQQNLDITIYSPDCYNISATAETKASKSAVAIINPDGENPEWVAFGGAFLDIDTEKIRLTDVSRGRFGTTAKEYPAGTKIVIFIYAGISYLTLNQATQVEVTAIGVQGEADKLTKQAILNNDYYKPYPFDQIKVNGKTSGDISEDLVFEFLKRDRTACKESKSLITESSPAQATTAVLQVQVLKQSNNNTYLTKTIADSGNSITNAEIKSALGLDDNHEPIGIILRMASVQTIDGQQRTSEVQEQRYTYTRTTP